MKLTLPLLTALLLAPLAALHAADTRPAKPNFVVILIDDMGYGDIGPFGSKLNRTPNLDRMAAEGMKLTSFYCAPLCSARRVRAKGAACRPKQCACSKRHARRDAASEKVEDAGKACHSPGAR